MRTGELLSRAARCLAGVAVCMVAGTPARGEERLTMEAAMRRAIERNPAVIEAQAEVDAARAQGAGLGLPLLRDNPEVEVSAGSRSIDDEDRPEYEIRVEQPLDVMMQRSARKGTATAALAAAQARLNERKAATAARVRQAFGRALAAQRLEELAADASALASRARESAQERYEAGAASLIELNTARVEEGKSQRSKLEAGRRKVAALADLRLLLAVNPSEEFSLEGELPSGAEDRDLDMDELVRLAKDRRPDLIAARHDLDAAMGEARLAGREAVPLPKIGASYGEEDEEKILLGIVSWDLPIFNRNQAGRGLADARVRQAAAHVEALERQVALDVELAVNEWRSARETLAGFTDADLAAVDENVALSTEGYEGGQIDFLQVLLARRAMLEVRSGFIDAQEALNTAEASLDQAMGTTATTSP